MTDAAVRLTHVLSLIEAEPVEFDDADGMVGALRRLCSAAVKAVRAAARA